MDDRGFYFAYEQGELFGFSFAILYNTEEKDFQIGLQIFDLNLAIGYQF